MKKISIVFLSILLVIVTFSSCAVFSPNDKKNEDSFKDANDSETNILPDESSVESSNEKDVPCLERYVFSSIDDFKFFCTTASRDISRYSSQSVSNAFPPFNMLEGCFVDVTDLFPGLDKNSVTVDHVEISSSGNYSYSGYTNTGKTPFGISVKYKDKSSAVTVADVIAANIETCNQVVNADYYDPENKVDSSKGSTLFVFEQNGYIIQYYVYNNKVQGMAIYSGDYIIGLSPCYSDNDAFFTDETLKPLSCVFSGDGDRVNALNTIAAFTKSK